MKKSVVVLLLSSIFQIVNSCIITFTNDGPHTIRILNIHDGTFSDINRGKSRRFGSEHERAHIKIYEQRSKNVYDMTFEVEQTQCAHHGNPQLKYTQLQEKGSEAALFKITQNPHPHKSMIQKIRNRMSE